MIDQKLTIELLKSMVPKWCYEGALVWIDCVDDGLKVGMILDLFFIDPDCVSEAEYRHLLEFDEWMIITCYCSEGITDYGLEELTKYHNEEN